MNPRARAAALAVMVVLPGLLSCDQSFRMDSDWRTEEVRIDGSDAEWRNALAYVESANVSLGAFNDAENLYLCLVTTDVSVERQIRMGGLTVWLDVTGKNKKTFGVRFPLGRPGGPGGSGNPPGMEPAGGFPGSGRMETSEDREARREEMHQAFETMQSSVEILGPGENDRREVPLSQSGGLEAKVGMENGRFVYELKVPLIRASAVSRAAAAEQPVSVSTCFKTENFTPLEGRGRPAGGRGPGGGGPPPGGRGGMDPGGFGGGPGGPPSGGMDEGPEAGRLSGSESGKTIQMRVEIRLAAPSR